MIKLNDIAVSKTLDRKACEKVRGGNYTRPAVMGFAIYKPTYGSKWIRFS